MIMKYLQKLGKAMMLPVACMPVCGILMGIGYLLCPHAMQGGEIAGFMNMTGFFLIKAGSAVIDNIAILFVIGVGVGMSEDNDGTGALAALVSWFVITILLNTNTISTLAPSLVSRQTASLAFDKIQNPFIGILAGIMGSSCYNRFKNTKLPEWLSFFSGKRCVAIIAAVISLVCSLILLFVWPLVFGGLVSAGNGIVKLGAVGAGIYAFLNRLLIPFGLHHALNNVFWFDSIGLGDLTNFWIGKTSADVGWSLGMYMSGFFPCMMFGIPAACLAMIRCAKKEKRKVAIGLLSSAAVCSFICGVTEPFEFAFMFLAPGLYVVYAILYGIFSFVVTLIGFRAGFCFSGGAIDLLFSASLPAAQKTWLIIPLGIAAFAVFYSVFRFAIIKFNLKTPGREDDEENSGASLANVSSDSAYAQMASVILEGLGGKQNLISIDNCVTRLRLEVSDMSIIDEAKIKSSGAKGIIKPGKNSIQIIIGTTVQFVADELKSLVKKGSTPFAAKTASSYRRVNHGDLLEINGASCAQQIEGGFVYTITDEVGIHARPAGEFAKLVKSFDCVLTVSANGKTASGTSLTELMNLAAVKGTSITVKAEGVQAQQALSCAKEFLEQKL